MTKQSRRVWLYVLLVIVGIAPLASVFLAGVIAEYNGCGLHEGFAQPCVVMGTDIDGILHTMVALGWLMLISLMFLASGLFGLTKEGLIRLIGLLRR